MYVCICVYACICMYVFMYVCKYVCVYMTEKCTCEGVMYLYVAEYAYLQSESCRICINMDEN